MRLWTMLQTKRIKVNLLHAAQKFLPLNICNYMSVLAEILKHMIKFLNKS